MSVNQEIRLYRKSLKTKPSQRPGMKQKVSFSREAGATQLPAYNTIDVINYYVEIEHENELARKRSVAPPPPPPSDPGEELPHNTIISLPKINK